MAATNSTSKRGFASMDGQRQREIASKGGRSVPAEKRSFSEDRELAVRSGTERRSGFRRNAQCARVTLESSISDSGPSQDGLFSFTMYHGKRHQAHFPLNTVASTR